MCVCGCVSVGVGVIVRGECVWVSVWGESKEAPLRQPFKFCVYCTL